MMTRTLAAAAIAGLAMAYTGAATPAHAIPAPAADVPAMGGRAMDAQATGTQATGGQATGTQVAPGHAGAARTPARRGRNCVIVVGKAPAGRASPVLAKACGRARNAAALRNAAVHATLLMEWFEHARNKPSSLTRVYGDSGPCDRDGYRVRADGFWANRISGFTTWNGCNIATAYNLANASGERRTWTAHWNISARWVGTRMNDRIEAFWLRHG